MKRRERKRGGGGEGGIKQQAEIVNVGNGRKRGERTTGKVKNAEDRQSE